MTLHELVAGGAHKKLDASPEIKAQMKLAQHKVLVGAWFVDYFNQNLIKDEQVREEYNLE